MKITIIADVLGQANNGTTVTCLRLIKGLKELGHEVKVVSPMVTDEEGFYTLSTRSFWPFNNYVAKNGVSLAKPDRKILEEAIKGSDVVHCMLPFKTGIMAMKIAHEMHIPVTGAFHCQAENVTSHLKLEHSKIVNRYIYKRFKRKFFKYVDYVHCPSEFIKNVLIKQGYDNKLTVISNGVAEAYKLRDVKKPESLKDKICILTIGRLSKEKRHDLLIDAINLSKYKDKIQLIIAGKGPLEKKTIKRCKKLKNPAIIDFYSEHDLVDIINYSDLYVHPADVEIEAIACLEAITCGLVPIISDSDNSATNYFAQFKENLFKAGDALDLAKKIDYLIENPEKVQMMKETYLEYAKKFQINYSINKMVEMFEEAIKNYHEEA